MDNKLTQDYKDNLYEKVLEKKARRTANRKRLASICVVFFIVACFATYGYTKYEKENYNNYFLTESENIYIDDEYEYFDDLGIKIEFINTDKDSITIGVNIKYEDIADYRVGFDGIIIDDGNVKLEYNDEKEIRNGIEYISYDYKMVNKDEIICMLCVKKKKQDMNNIEITMRLDNCVIANYNDEEINKIKMNYNKKISIEE